MTKDEAIMVFISLYGTFNRTGHKNWLLDVISRIAHGGEVRVLEARWENGHSELRYIAPTYTNEYWEWRNQIEKCSDTSCGCNDPTSDHRCWPYDEGYAP